MPVSQYLGTSVYLKLHQFRINICTVDQRFPARPPRSPFFHVERFHCSDTTQNTLYLCRSRSDVITLLFRVFEVVLQISPEARFFQFGSGHSDRE